MKTATAMPTKRASRETLNLRIPAAERGLVDRAAQARVQIKTWHRESDASRKLVKIPGIGPITASALIANIGNAKQFDDGRQLAAWLGLVPKQHSSGGK